MTVHIIPTLSDNYSYLIESANGNILVDCGEAAPVLRFLKEHGLTLDAILCTHHHDDHIAGFAELKQAFPELRVYAPRKDLPRIDGADTGVDDGQTLVLAGYDFRCIETPGHTRNHICFYSEKLNAIFSGDTLFSLGCGRLFEGTPDEMFESLQKLKQLPDDTLVYAGHEYTATNLAFSLSVTPDDPELLQNRRRINKMTHHYFPTLPVLLADEKRMNLFLRAESAKEFAHLRQLRDQFR